MHDPGQVGIGTERKLALFKVTLLRKKVIRRAGLIQGEKSKHLLSDS
jgi:hypothetical protein